MNTNLKELLQTVTDFLKAEAKTETIIGSQFQLGEHTCVPVMSVGMGFGSMSGEGKGCDPRHNGEGEGRGAGGGMGLQPVGFLVSKGGDLSFVSAKSSRGLGALLEKMPDIMERVMEKKCGPQAKAAAQA